MFEDKIDFPVSKLWRRHYASQGLTYDCENEYIEELEIRVERLERMNDNLMRMMEKLMKPEVEETTRKAKQKNDILRRF